VESRTSEETQLSINFVEFMMIAALIAAVGILLDSPILIVGAMVVGPEFGPIAAASPPSSAGPTSPSAPCSRWRSASSSRSRSRSAGRSCSGGRSSRTGRAMSTRSRNPDFFSFFVAYLAGTAGVLSLTSAKSGALIGVLISVTTIPAAATIAVATAWGDWGEVGGASAQLSLNVVALFLGGIARLYAAPRLRGAAQAPSGRARTRGARARARR
jgi:hypothetical protein